MSSQPAGNINVGAVFERVLNTYGKTWRVLITGALIVFAPIAVLAGLLVASGGGGAAFLAVAAAIVGTFWYQGMVVETVQDVQDGTVDNSVGQLFSSVTPVLGRLIGVGFLAAIGLAIGFVLLIVPGLILLTIWAVVAPVVVIERKGVLESFGRSRELVRGNGWQVFGVLVALFALNIALSIVVSIIGSAGDAAAVIAQLLQYLAFAPVSALAAAILFFALREAHGDAALANPTGVLSGGFVPPVPPAVEPEAPVRAEPPVEPEAPQPAPAQPDPSLPLPDPPLTQPGSGVQQPRPPLPKPDPPASAPAPPPAEPAAATEPASPTPAAEQPDPPLTQPDPPPTQPDPPPTEPDPGVPGDGDENASARGAFGDPEPARADPFGSPAGDESPPPAPPRDPGESVPPPGWTPPAGS